MPHLAQLDQVPANDWQPVDTGSVGGGDFRPAIADHYLTNPVARASALMADLSRRAKARGETALAAE